VVRTSKGALNSRSSERTDDEIVDCATWSRSAARVKCRSPPTLLGASAEIALVENKAQYLRVLIASKRRDGLDLLAPLVVNELDGLREAA
jgi:hypothetical protein